MNIKAKLKFNDSRFQYDVIECDYEYTQQVDQTLKPCAMPKSGIVNIILESMVDRELIQWMVAPANVRSGEITFYKDDSHQTILKSLSFNDAICIRYHEKFTAFSESPMLTTISFVAKELGLDGVFHSANWSHF